MAIPKVTEKNKVITIKIAELVEIITEQKLTDSGLDTSEHEIAIDELVYKLYELDEDEIKLINDSISV